MQDIEILEVYTLGVAGVGLIYETKGLDREMGQSRSCWIIVKPSHPRGDLKYKRQGADKDSTGCPVMYRRQLGCIGRISVYGQES